MRVVEVDAAGSAYIRPDSVDAQVDHGPPDIRKRLQWCQVAIWADDLPPDASEYGELELYLAAQNAGQKLSVPGIRH